MTGNVRISKALICECGNIKSSKTDEACERCMFLDGSTAKRSSLVINALRGERWMSIEDLTIVIYGVCTHSSRRSVLRFIRELEADGRLSKEWDDRERLGSFRQFGKVTIDRVNAGRWLYRLDDRRAA